MIKNIILTSANENINIKGVLSLETTSSKTLINLKTYNFSKSVAKFVLGLKCGADFYKVELLGDEDFIINKPLNLNEKVSACVLKIENNKSEILIWGSNETNRVWQNSFLNDFEKTNNENLHNSFYDNSGNSENLKLSKQSSSDKLFTESCDETHENKVQNFNENIGQNAFVYNHGKENQNFNDKNQDFSKTFSKENQNDIDENEISLENFDDKNDYSDFETDEEIEKIVDESLNKFAEFENENENEENFNSSNNESDFLSAIKSQIDELLNNYEEEKALENIIPNSKFVKVNSSGENFYVFGVIYEHSAIKYIVYGIPGEFNVKPDDEYKNFYQWLPLNNENPEGYGYYLMYQDALSGNQVEVILE